MTIPRYFPNPREPEGGKTHDGVSFMSTVLSLVEMLKWGFVQLNPLQHGICYTALMLQS